MSIIEQLPVQIPTAEDVVRQIKSVNYQVYQSLKDAIQFGYNNVWQNPNSTPEEIIGTFGTDAKALFELSGQAQQLLKQLDPTYEIKGVPDGYTVSFDDSGVATVDKSVTN